MSNSTKKQLPIYLYGIKHMKLLRELKRISRLRHTLYLCGNYTITDNGIKHMK
jgi:hypothetical protein